MKYRLGMGDFDRPEDFFFEFRKIRGGRPTLWLLCYDFKSNYLKSGI